MVPLRFPRNLPLPACLVVLICLQFTACNPRPPAPSYEGYGYLLVAPETLLPSVEDLAAYKESKGFLVDTVSLEEILAASPGNDDPEKVRNYLLGYSALTSTREFVLLVGSMDTLPMRIAYPDPNDHGRIVPTDFYYEELTGGWDADSDGFYGEYGDDMSKMTDDYVTELYVGRLPWDETEEILAICDAIISYQEDTSSRMTRTIGAAATIQEPCDAALYVQTAMLTVAAPAGYESITLYEDCPALAPDFELTRDNFLTQWEVHEPGLVSWFSHGFWGATDFISVDEYPQEVKPAVVLTSACTVGAPDAVSVGRVLVREGLAAGFLGGTRSTYFGYNPIPCFTAQFKVGTSLITEQRALADAKRVSIEYLVRHEQVPQNLSGDAFHQDLFGFIIYGDPSVQLR